MYNYLDLEFEYGGATIACHVTECEDVENLHHIEAWAMVGDDDSVYSEKLAIVDLHKIPSVKRIIGAVMEDGCVEKFIERWIPEEDEETDSSTTCPMGKEGIDWNYTFLWGS